MLVAEGVETVSEADPSRGPALVDEEPVSYFEAVEHVEGVDDVLEAQVGRGLDQVLVGQLTQVVRAAGIQELTALGCRLTIDHSEVTTQVPGERDSQLLERHQLQPLGTKFQKRVTERELVRGDISPEQDQRPPMRIDRRPTLGELGNRLPLGHQPSVHGPATHAGLSRGNWQRRG